MPGTPTIFLEDSDQPRPFRQRRYFYYLSGVDEPDCHLLYDIDHDLLTLFIPTFDAHKIVWAGRGSDKTEALHKYDVDQVKWVTSLQSVVRYALKNTKGKLYILHPSQLPPSFSNKDTRIDFSCLQDAINRCRVIKDPHEIQLIRKANEISAEAHRAVLNRIRSFRNEAQVEAIFKDVCITNGSKHQAYPVIAASGVNAATLHYIKNDESLIGRQLLILDAGAEYSCYASDITRTIPLGLPGPGWVNNWPSSEAAEIHDLVLTMQTECIKMLKPGVQFRDLQVLAHAILIRGFLKLGIFQGDEEEILQQGTSLAFFPHGLGHHVGLEVHDVLGIPIWVDKSCASNSVNSIDSPQKSNSTLTCSNYPHLVSPDLWIGLLSGFSPGPFWAVDAANHGLIEGMVITVEPGIYFSPYALETIYLPSPIHSKFINKDVLKRYMPVGGVRIEDDVLITHDGYENLTTAPKGAEMWELLKNGSEKEQPLTTESGRCDVTNVRLKEVEKMETESRSKKTTTLTSDELTLVERLRQSISNSHENWSQVSLSTSTNVEKEKSLPARTDVKSIPSELPWTEVDHEQNRVLRKDSKELRHHNKIGQEEERNEARSVTKDTDGTSTHFCNTKEYCNPPGFALQKDEQKALSFSPRKRPAEMSLPIRNSLRCRSSKRGKTLFECTEDRTGPCMLPNLREEPPLHKRIEELRNNKNTVKTTEIPDIQVQSDDKWTTEITPKLYFDSKFLSHRSDQTSAEHLAQSGLPKISNVPESNNSTFGSCSSCLGSHSKYNTVEEGEKCGHCKRNSITHGIPSHFYSFERSMKSPLRISSLENQPTVTPTLRNCTVQVNRQESDSTFQDYVTPLKHLEYEGSRKVVRMHSEPCLQSIHQPSRQPVSTPFSPLRDVQTVLNQPTNPILPSTVDEDPSWDIMGCESCSARGFKCELDHFNEIASPQHAHYPHPATTSSLSLPSPTPKVIGGQSQDWSNHWTSMWRSGAFGWQVPRPPSKPPSLSTHLVPSASNLSLTSSLSSATTSQPTQTLQSPLTLRLAPPPGLGSAKIFPPFPPQHMTFMQPPMPPPIPPPIPTSIPPSIPPPILPPMPPLPPMTTSWTNLREQMEQEYKKLMNKWSFVETPALPPKPAEYKRKNFSGTR